MWLDNSIQYDLILVDPPWKYSKRSNKNTKFGLGSSQREMLTVKELMAYPVASIAKPESLCFMWTTMPMLHDAMNIMDAWGFEYKTNAFSWVKVNKLDLRPVFGIGFYTKSNIELCLLGTKGEKAIKPRNNDVSSVILHPPMEFAHKPSEVMEGIDRMYPDLQKIELFAKEKWDGPGWTQMEYKAPSKEIMDKNVGIER